MLCLLNTAMAWRCFMKTTEHRLLSFDATPLFYRLIVPEGLPRGRVYVLHGMGEHGGRYQDLAGFLGKSGLECVIPDLRGFGKSGGERAYADSFGVFHEDFECIRNFIEKSRPNPNVFVLGHSFGGLLAASFIYMRGASVRGLVLSSPLFGVASRVPFWRSALGLVAAEIFPRYSQNTNVRPELLTHDPGVISAYGKDPLIYHKISARLYRELLKLMAQRTAIAQGLRCPVLVMQAGDDRIVDKEKTIAFYKELNTQDKDLKVYPRLYHEILNEAEHLSLIQTISAWISSRISS